MSSSALNIASLPPDIIRKVIEVGLESLNTMRLLSHQWNVLALEILSIRKHLPVIKNFEWGTVDIGCWILEARVSNKFRNYFGFDNWKSIPDDHNRLWFRKILFKRKVNDKKLREELSRIFGRCSMIDRIELTIGFDDKIHVFTDALRGIVVNKIEIGELTYFSKENLSTILKFIRSPTIKQLEIDVCSDDISDLKWDSNKSNISTFFTKASLLVPSITLNISYFYEKRSDEELMDYWRSKVDALPKLRNCIATVEAESIESSMKVWVTVVPNLE